MSNTRLLLAQAVGKLNDKGIIMLYRFAKILLRSRQYRK